MSAYDLMKLCAKFKREKSAYVWVALVKNFQEVLRLVVDSNECFEKLRDFLLNDLFRDIVDLVGYESKPNDGKSRIRYPIANNIKYF